MSESGKEIAYFYEFGPFRIDPAQRLLMRDGQVMQVPPKVFDTLLLMVESNGRVLEKNEMMEALWPGVFVEEGSLTQNVSTLRKLLGESAEQHYIDTLPKRGYRFVAEVQRVADDSAPPGLIFRRRTTAQIITTEEDDEIGAKNIPATEALALPSPKTRSKPIWIVAAAALVVLLTLGGFLIWRNRPKPPATSAEVRTLAVLPFSMLSEDAGDKYLGLGMADALITELSSVRQVVVRSTSSVRKYVDARQIDPTAAGREMGVDAVMEGNVQRNGERVRVSVRLLRVADGATLWGHAFDEKLTDILSIQETISQKVVDALTLQLTKEEGERLRKRYTNNPEAHQLYLKGRYFWNKRDAESFRKAIDFFTQATDLDPNYALAYAGIADCYNLLPGYAQVPADETFPKAKAAAEKAISLDESLAEAHASLAFAVLAYDFEWDRAGRELQRAIALNQNYETAHQWLAMNLYRLGRFDESLNYMRRAQELDPLSPSIANGVGLSLLFARRYDEALAQFDRVIKSNPNFAPAHYQKGIVLLKKSMCAEATASFTKVNELLKGSALANAGVARAHACAGRNNEALKMLDELKEQVKQGKLLPFSIAQIYAAVGDGERALEWLERCYRERDVNVTYIKVDPFLDNLRSDPRFVDLMRRVGLAPQ